MGISRRIVDFHMDNIRSKLKKDLLAHGPFTDTVVDCFCRAIGLEPRDQFTTKAVAEAAESVQRLYARLGLGNSVERSTAPPQINWDEFEQLMFAQGEEDVDDQPPSRPGDGAAKADQEHPIE
jgi:hypothetical protein